jgi:hypothetical protein
MYLNRNDRRTRDNEMLSGIDKYVTQPITIGGTLYTREALKLLFELDRHSIDVVAEEREEFARTIVAARQLRKKTQKVCVLLREAIIGHFGRDATDVLGDFGLLGPKEGRRKKGGGNGGAIVKRGVMRDTFRAGAVRH